MDPLTEMQESINQQRLRFRSEVRTILHNVQEFADRLENAIGEISGPQATDAFIQKFLEEYKDSIKRLGYEAYVCQYCGAISYNPNDIKNNYCGRCHKFAGE